MTSSNRFLKGLTALSSCAIVLSTSVAVAQTRPAPSPTAASPRAGAAIYERAKQELPKDMYVLYRVIDRIARANGLNERPWRIAIVPQYQINAFSTDVNLVAMYSGVLDQLAGDSSALACIVGHEMGHSVKRHIALGKAQRAALAEQAKKEAEAEVEQEIRSTKRTVTTNTIAGGLLGVLGGRLGRVGNNLGSAGENVLDRSSQQRVDSAQTRVAEIAQKKQAELEKRYLEAERRQEFEADETGYIYAARAGFEPDGCMRAMAVLSRTPGAEFDTNHPAVPKRIEALRQMMTKYPAASLVAEGKAKIAATQPLTYDLSSDKVSLRVNSRFGGSSQSDIERLFDK